MSASILGLPPVPAELKPALPYLQRAEELKKQDPIISYWCAYYAAQVGISLKARDTKSKDVLFALLGALEHMKADIGASDAIDIEAVSSAYVENFALKVFANADNEDRSGRATRSTAKKFLAAANFLEVLKTFPKKDISESNEDKIRYAKWKAADIAKAFREGRKPAPGPPGWADEQDELKRLQEQEFSMPTPPRPPAKTSSESTLISASPPRVSVKPPSPPHLSHLPPPLSSSLHAGWSDPPSESWSTAATPGTGVPDTYSPTGPVFGWSEGTPVKNIGTKPRSGSVSSSNTINSTSGSARGALQKAAWTNEELEGKYQPPTASPPKSAMKSGSPDSDKRVRFSPPTIGSPPPVPPPPTSGSPTQYTGPESIYAPTQHPISPPTITTPPHSIAGYPSIPPPPPHSNSPPGSYIYAPSPPAQTSPTRAVYSSAPPPPPPIPVAEVFELTPTIIAKAQRHCRFAISSLDYEDAEQARKELRAALALLGG